MSIGVNSNWASLKSANLMNRYTNSLQTSVERITSGARINSTKDDPVGLGISERMRDRIGATEQASRNVQNDTSLLKTADGALTNTVDIIHRLKELAVQKADAANTTNDLNVIHKQASLLIDQIDHNATVKWGDQLVSGRSLDFHIGGESNFNVSMSVGDFSVKGLSTKDTASLKVMFGSSADVYSSSNPLITTYKADRTVDKEGALDAMLKNALSIQADVGGMEETLGYVADGLSSEITTLQAADSQLRDTDIAKEMSNYVKNNILLQASQFMAAQENQNAYSVLTLLQ